MVNCSNCTSISECIEKRDLALQENKLSFSKKEFKSIKMQNAQLRVKHG